MKDRLDGNRVGLVLGFFVAFIHLLWGIAVLGNFAQAWMDWIFGLHMVNDPIVVGAFNWGTAILLLIVAFVIGYILGWIFAWVHNFVHKK